MKTGAVLYVLGLVVVAALVGGGAFALRRALAGGEGDGLAGSAPVPAEGAPPAPTDPDHPTWADPEPLRGFLTWEGSRRLKVVTSLQGDPELGPAVLACVRRLVRDRSLRPVVRNGLANCLVDQAKPDPGLHRLFRTMLDDPAEGEIWRDYCVQFLACCAPFADDRDAVVKTLQAVAAQEGSDLAGTALLHLLRLEELELAKLPQDLPARLAARLEEPGTTEATRLAILGLLGLTDNPAHLPVIRRVLTDPSSKAVVRGALGALARLGGPEDLPLVRPWRDHEDEAVALAAGKAWNHLSTLR